jgi:predicted extracellular nuclease
MIKFPAVAATLLFVVGINNSYAAMRITEWMYNGLAAGSIGEFVELTNVGNAPVDMSGWSFDDDSRAPGTISLSAFGTAAPGESVVLTDNTAAAFAAAWGLDASVKIIGGNTANLSRNDEINIFDATNALVDRLTYGDQNFAGTIRTSGTSGIPETVAALGVNDPTQWNLAAVGDSFASQLSSDGDVGNPGSFTIPEPATGLLLIFAAMLCQGAWSTRF